jgi:N-acyl-D-aspartate/D-glutamate deacylase
MRNQAPIDAFLDLALDENLETIFWNANNGGDSKAMGEILRSPYVLIGTSDAGAHVLFGADFGYGTILLGLWVRERQVMSLEQAIHKLTFHPASIFGLQGLGLLRRCCNIRFDPRLTQRSQLGRQFSATANAWQQAIACITPSSTHRDQ